MFRTNHKTFSEGSPKSCSTKYLRVPCRRLSIRRLSLNSLLLKCLARVRRTAFWSSSQRAQTRVLDSVTSIQFAMTCGPVAFRSVFENGNFRFEAGPAVNQFRYSSSRRAWALPRTQETLKLDRMQIIFVSSKIEAYWRENAIAVGAIGYIEKPLDTASLSDVASLVLG